MGNFTPNIGLYIPAAGETNYNDAFAQGMINLDQHDHTGGPNKGLPITSSGLADFSVTFNKLASNVVDPTTGVGVNSTPGSQNQIQLLGILRNLFTLSSLPGVGFVSMNGSTVVSRQFQNSSTITFTNPDGVSGDPSADLSVPVAVSNGGTGLSSLVPYSPLMGGATATDPMIQPSIGNIGDILTSQGSSSPPIFTSPGSLGQIEYSTVTLTAAQVRTLNANPVQIVAAPGSGKVLVPIFCYGLLTYVGTPFSGGFPLAQITVSYNSTDSALNFSANAFVGSTSDVYSWCTQSTLSTSGGIAKTSIQNTPLTLKNYNNEFTGGGTSTITFVLAYTTITL